MNRSTLENVTGFKVKSLSRESWTLLTGDLYVPPFIEKGKKESTVFQKLHDAFWKVRRAERLEMDDFKCVECRSNYGVTVDHIVNRSQGGTHAINNLQTLCLTCHDDKTNRRGKWAK